ncbi:MAG: hypothetical protein Q8K88_12710 [Bradyrhizobium sp.]|nr:hypothetical protein [Bradyrhizobium sp.]
MIATPSRLEAEMAGRPGDEDLQGCDGGGDDRFVGHASPRPGQAPKGRAQEGRRKEAGIDEKAYKAALERIPESKEKYDPWGAARPAEPARKAK